MNNIMRRKFMSLLLMLPLILISIRTVPAIPTPITVSIWRLITTTATTGIRCVTAWLPLVLLYLLLLLFMLSLRRLVLLLLPSILQQPLLFGPSTGEEVTKCYSCGNSCDATYHAPGDGACLAAAAPTIAARGGVVC